MEEPPPMPEIVSFYLRVFKQMLRETWVFVMAPGILGKKMWGAGTMWGGPNPWPGWENAKVRFWISVGFWMVLPALVVVSMLIIGPPVGNTTG